jgi:endonuclease YncB( thermonuclease family)
MVRTTAFLLLFISVVLPQSAEAFSKPVPGRVVFISDGDTLVVKPDKGHRFTCRLYGIDAPETPHEGRPGQPYGRESAETLSHLVMGMRVEVILTGEKSYNREVCVVMHGEKDINLRMIKSGLAWAYKKHLRKPYRKPYIEAEATARKKGLGIWADGDAITPSEFKREFWK